MAVGYILVSCVSRALASSLLALRPRLTHFPHLLMSCPRASIFRKGSAMKFSQHWTSMTPWIMKPLLTCISRRPLFWRISGKMGQSSGKNVASPYIFALFSILGLTACAPKIAKLGTFWSRKGLWFKFPFMQFITTREVGQILPHLTLNAFWTSKETSNLAGKPFWPLEEERDFALE